MSDNQFPAIAGSMGYAPIKGPKSLKIVAELANAIQVKINLMQQLAAYEIEFIQNVYVDNSENNSQVIIEFDNTTMRLVIPPNTQGCWPVYAPNPVEFTVASTGGIDVPLWFTNMPAPHFVFTVNETGIPSVTPAPFQVDAITDRSGSITAGGTSQVLMAANPNRTGFVITNPVTDNPNSESLFVNFGAAASSADSIEIAPGGRYDSAGIPVFTGAIEIVGATTGTVYTAKEM